jgi:hypothetical protein
MLPRPPRRESYREARFSYINFVTPRWLVKEWGATKTIAPCKAGMYTKTAPRKLAPLEFHDSY